ncbi:mechanosensitive ion channel domain-containing protein [Nitratiruptor sp. SB155-2]|uniref:mechanosensitive ion channel domain-containing protein n=1 Tax=Nitratiruptor sp. (strain SB155-2) TaxID=387092 RepID=UPI00015873EA|nr:mechanosensitive ion channel domain-containing protein [Nitratiruptor sp. SB155-2]BAF70191.1 mechanosensitive ion channel [Nitratiruptor sp. SB155-2]
MLKLLLVVFLSLLSLYAEQNASIQEQQEQQEIQKRFHLQELQADLNHLKEKIEQNIWLKKYENYKTYYKISKELKDLDKQIWKAKRRRQKKRLQDLLAKKETLKNQLELLKEYQESPFMEIVKPPTLPKPPTIKNPFDIITALSYIKQLNSSKEYYLQKLQDMQTALDLLNKKYHVLSEMAKLDPDAVPQDELKAMKKEIKDFQESLKVAKETLRVYKRKIEENVLKTTDEIKIQGEKAFRIGAIILGILLFSLFLKWIIHRYIQDNQRAYMANKFINFLLALLIIMILLFSYIENVGYLVTILGFASAGIAIAMKDMFMSLLGWMVIVFGGSIHVGDRIKVKRNGLEYVGDVVDISLLRITILEDVTLTSYLHNIRSGRIIFVPNNYIFTDLIANYTHSGLKTVWDNINFNITFDSNHKKAAHIAKETARKYAKGYTDIARKQLNKLRSTYHLKNTNVDVRVYTFAEDYGIRISLWYQTNSYATLTLRSTISAEVIEKYLQEEDIKITYPAQKIFLTKEDFNDKSLPKESEAGV